MNKRPWMGLIIFLLILSMTTACSASNKSISEVGKSNTKANQSQTKKEATTSLTKQRTSPVTLKFYANLQPEQFKNWIAGPVKSKYPNITLQQIRPTSKYGLQQMVASGDVPDILLDTAYWRLEDYKKYNMRYDLTGIIKKNHFDLSKFEPVLVNNIKAESNSGKLYALPYSRYADALFYNKTIFDTFGVPYPKDTMTWDQIYQLAKRVTGVRSSVQYRGLDPDWYQRSATQLNLKYVDPKTDKAIVTSDQYVKFATFLKGIYDIPGNLNKKKPQIGQGKNLFPKKKNIAMWAYGLSASFWDVLKKAEDQGLNWNMVSYPTFKDAPGIGPDPEGQILAISPTSKHKDQAFQVISYLVSKKNEIAMAKRGDSPSLKASDVLKHYAEDIPAAKGKNVMSVFIDKPAAVSKNTSQYDRLAGGKAWGTFIDIATDKKDVVTALRELNERINQMIKKAKESS